MAKVLYPEAQMVLCESGQSRASRRGLSTVTLEKSIRSPFPMTVNTSHLDPGIVQCESGQHPASTRGSSKVTNAPQCEYTDLLDCCSKRILTPLQSVGEHSVESVTFSDDGQWITSRDNNGIVITWSVSTGEQAESNVIFNESRPMVGSHTYHLQVQR